MKKLLTSVIVAAVLFSSKSVAFAAAPAFYDNAMLSNGIITLAYNAESDIRIKVLVEKKREESTVQSP